MPTVELKFGALPAHVRTARLVAAAVARRSGVDDALIDEVKLAVGEACARALTLHQRHAPEQQVVVLLEDSDADFVVTVKDVGPGEETAVIPAARTEDVPAFVESVDIDDEAAPTTSPLQLALISGLVDELSVERAGTTTLVRMRWKLS